MYEGLIVHGKQEEWQELHGRRRTRHAHMQAGKHSFIDRSRESQVTHKLLPDIVLGTFVRHSDVY